MRSAARDRPRCVARAGQSAGERKRINIALSVRLDQFGSPPLCQLLQAAANDSLLLGMFDLYRLVLVSIRIKDEQRSTVVFLIRSLVSTFVTALFGYFLVT